MNLMNKSEENKRLITEIHSKQRLVQSGRKYVKNGHKVGINKVMVNLI